MKRNSTARKIKITPVVREAYEKRDKRLDKADPENPVLPPEIWANGVIGKFYRPMKTAVSVRVDNDVLEWLKSKGEGHLTRINEILRQQMMAERK
jgi:uncharacterized protein (DUF4415 family)